jgi:cytochrome bd ubiquinol oxidase subunit II
VVEAYLAGLETFVAGNGDLSRISCYPKLIATTEPAYSLTIFNTSAGEYGVRVGVVWDLIGFVLVIAYRGDAYR